MAAVLNDLSDFAHQQTWPRFCAKHLKRKVLLKLIKACLIAVTVTHTNKHVLAIPNPK